MLTYEQIITLSDKGFSPDQIVKLTGEEIQEPAPEATPEEETETPAPQDQEEQPAPEPSPASLSSVLNEAIKGFSAEVAEMRKALQASNIRNVIREDIPPSKSADDILAEMIHPTIKGGK